MDSCGKSLQDLNDARERLTVESLDNEQDIEISGEMIGVLVRVADPDPVILLGYGSEFGFKISLDPDPGGGASVDIL